MLSKICPRCRKRAKKNPDGFACITCGWNEYITPKVPRKVKGRVPYIDKFHIPYKGTNPKYSRLSIPLLTLLYQTKKNLDKIFYFMHCPVNQCGDRRVGKKTWQYSLRNKEEDYFRFLCTDKHLWYLVVLNGEPRYWLTNDMEVDMPTGIGTYGKKRGRPPKKKKMKK